MDNIETKAIINFAQDMITALSSLVAALESKGSTPGTYGKTTMRLPWSERTLRQSMIIQEILEMGGSITRDEWYRVAAKYGYEGRGLAGFFRSDGSGLLEMRRDKIVVTKHGRERLKENQDRIPSTTT